MTRIIKKGQTPTGKPSDKLEIIEVKPVFYDGKELAEIDLTETTAWTEFCGIRFKNSNEVFFIPHYRLMIEWKQ